MKNIIFDVGGVILKKETQAYFKKNLIYEDDAEIIVNELYNSVENCMLDRGIITKEELLSKALSRIPERSRIQARELYEGYSCNRVAIKGMPELIKKLKDKGLSVYVLSNFSIDFKNVIAKNNLDFFKYFDGVFVSSEYGVVKPERQIYRIFLDKYRLNAQDCLFIDDKEQNVEAAIFSGMDGFHFRGNVQVLEEYIERRVKGDSYER